MAIDTIKLGFGLISLGVAATIAIWSASHPSPAETFRDLKIASSKYIIPNGCHTSNVNGLISVPRSCLTHQYLLENPFKYGLPKGYGRADWFRVGDDAVDLECPMFSGNCRIELVVHNRFSRKGVLPSCSNSAHHWNDISC